MNAPTSELSGMDDDQLVALLRETFASHEELADVYRAHRIALQPVARRRRSRIWLVPMAAAAAVAAVAAGGVALVPSHDRAPVGLVQPNAPVFGGHRAGPFQPEVSPSEAAAARAKARQSENNAAAREKAQVLAAQLGSILRRRWGTGAKHVAAAPAPDLRKTSPVPTAAAGTAWRTEWWSVDASLGEVTAYLAKHHPAGTGNGGLGHGEGTGTAAYTTDTWAARSTATYTDAQVGFVAQAWHGGTALRIGSYAAPRSARTAVTYVSEPVTSVEVDRVVGGKGPAPVITVTDPTTIAKLVHKLNSLPGVSVLGPDIYFGCPMIPSPEPSLTLVLHTASGDVWAQGGVPLCGPPAVQIVRTKPAAPQLDATDYIATVDRLLGLKANWWR